jgi:hypothetical protein
MDGTYRTYGTYEQIDAPAAFVIAARDTHADTPIPPRADTLLASPLNFCTNFRGHETWPPDFR